MSEQRAEVLADHIEQLRQQHEALLRSLRALQQRELRIPTFRICYDPLTGAERIANDGDGTYPIMRAEDVETFWKRRMKELADLLRPFEP